MNEPDVEEIWFARIAVILGAKELVDSLLNLCTILKASSGLPITSPSTDTKLATVYLVTSAVTGLYLVSGGRLLSRLAYGRSPPPGSLLGNIGFPEGSGWLAVAFRTFGALQIVQAVTSAGNVVVAHQRRAAAPQAFTGQFFPSVEYAWLFERAILGFALLTLGGKLARFFQGGRRTPPSAPPANF